jgi:hypothetical protein
MRVGSAPRIGNIRESWHENHTFSTDDTFTFVAVLRRGISWRSDGTTCRKFRQINDVDIACLCDAVSPIWWQKSTPGRASATRWEKQHRTSMGYGRREESRYTTPTYFRLFHSISLTGCARGGDRTRLFRSNLPMLVCIDVRLHHHCTTYMHYASRARVPDIPQESF